MLGFECQAKSTKTASGPDESSERHDFICSIIWLVNQNEGNEIEQPSGLAVARCSRIWGKSGFEHWGRGSW